ncbi:MAG: oxidoreductase, aldo/keto reductase [[Bacteroides] pectinophilus]|nr:oxidoreductase, aldo/keto reductase [[Bacteroides] pectinophilus]
MYMVKYLTGLISEQWQTNIGYLFHSFAEDMQTLKNFKKIESYGESGVFPVYGGKM